MNTLIIYKSGEVKQSFANWRLICRDMDEGKIENIIDIEKPLEPRIYLSGKWIKIHPLV